MDSKNLNKIKTAILELKVANMNCVTPKDVDEMIKKYKIRPANVDAITLNNSLRSVFGIEVSREDLHSIIPVLCEELGISCELHSVTHLGNPDGFAYCLTLPCKAVLRRE